MGNKTLVALGVACAALLVTAVYLQRQLQAQRALVDSATANGAELEARLEQLQARYDSLQIAYANRPVVQPAAKAAPSATRNPVESVDAESQEGRASFESPRERFAPRFSMAIGARFNQIGEFAHALKLNDTAAAKMTQILTDEQRKLRDAFQSTGQPPDQQIVDAIRQETDRQLLDALGQQKFDEYRDYREYLPEHERINRLNGRLASDQLPPLTADQQSRLLAAMKTEKNLISEPQASQFNSRAEFASAYDAWRRSYDARTQERAATILSPEQLAELRTVRLPPFRGGPR